jgi:hypothetical protein
VKTADSRCAIRVPFNSEFEENAIIISPAIPKQTVATQLVFFSV